MTSKLQYVYCNRNLKPWFGYKLEGFLMELLVEVFIWVGCYVTIIT